MVDSSADSLFYFYDKSRFSRHVVSINSEDRVDFDNTSSSDYTVYLKNPITQIVAIKLIGTVIPNTQYVVNETNNKIDFVNTGYPIVTPQSVVTNAVATLGTINSITLSATDLKADGYYNGYVIKINSGLASGDTRIINTYVTNMASVVPNFSGVVAAGDTYTLTPAPLVSNSITEATSISNHSAITTGIANTMQIAVIDHQPTNHFYTGYYITITSGVAAGSVCTITNYNQATDIITVSPAFSAIVGTGDTYTLSTNFTSTLALNNVAVGGSLTTVILAVGDLQADNYYNGCVIKMTSGLAAGQYQTIVSYSNATNTVTVNFSAAVAALDTYTIYRVFTESASQVLLDVSDLQTTGYYNGYVIELMGTGERRYISNYDGTTNVVSVPLPFSSVITGGLSYNIYTQYDTYASGSTALGGGLTSVVLSNSDKRATNFYIGYTIHMTGGASTGDIRTITGYNGTTNIAVVSTPFTAPIVFGDTYNLCNTNHWTAIIPPGSYNATELANLINAQMNATLNVPFSSEFIATYISYFQKFQVDCVTSGNTFSFLFGTGDNKQNSLAYIMGYGISPSDTALSTSSISPFLVRLSGPDYIYLCIRDLSTINEPRIKDPFARLIMDEPPKSIIYNSFISNAKVYRSPLSKLEKIDVRIVTKDNVLYNFNSYENSFTIEIYTLLGSGSA